jgi:hypothetical protein
MAWVWITEVVCHSAAERKIWINHRLRLDGCEKLSASEPATSSARMTTAVRATAAGDVHETYLPLDNVLIDSATNRPGHPRRRADPRGPAARTVWVGLPGGGGPPTVSGRRATLPVSGTRSTVGSSYSAGPTEGGNANGFRIE